MFWGFRGYNFIVIEKDNFDTKLVSKGWYFWVFADISAGSSRKKKVWNFSFYVFFRKISGAPVRQGYRTFILQDFFRFRSGPFLPLLFVNSFLNFPV